MRTKNLKIIIITFLVFSILTTLNCSKSDLNINTNNEKITNLNDKYPKILSSNATIHPKNSLIAQISGEIEFAGEIYVEYWSNNSERYRSHIEKTNNNNYKINIYRLTPNTEYNYEVFSLINGNKGHSFKIGNFLTGELPGSLKDSKLEIIGGTPTFDLIYLEFRQEDFLGLAAYNSKGEIVWYFEADNNEQPYVMSKKENGNLVYIAGFEGGTTSTGIVEITPDGKEVNRLDDICKPYGPIHHEVLALPNNQIMYLSREIREVELPNKIAKQEGDTIGIWDQNNNKNEIVWTIFDHISPMERTPSSNKTLPGNPIWGGCDRDRKVEDWSHGNSIDIGFRGNVIVSLAHLNQIISISPDFKNIEWRLGGEGSDFEFINTRDKFYHQHTATQLDNGNILLFDNGNFRPSDEGGQYSRALELRLDIDNMIATNVWEFPDGPQPVELGIFSPCCSSVERLKSGNTLVMFGSGLSTYGCCGPFIIAEVDNTGLVVWEGLHKSLNKRNQYRIYSAESIFNEIKLPN
tara:strand:- start:2260 stop:3822 length:1563 start_codon:yes stop_codon:yes gene_type:complete